ncbi:hypothetical protein HDU67_003523 [Dinochytrium kinnereticum]|nr:hypothetical protein HDU67_003523 [Dinochytrium kinnereticum]
MACYAGSWQTPFERVQRISSEKFPNCISTCNKYAIDSNRKFAIAGVSVSDHSNDQCFCAQGYEGTRLDNSKCRQCFDSQLPSGFNCFDNRWVLMDAAIAAMPTVAAAPKPPQVTQVKTNLPILAVSPKTNGNSGSGSGNSGSGSSGSGNSGSGNSGSGNSGSGNSGSGNSGSGNSGSGNSGNGNSGVPASPNSAPAPSPNVSNVPGSAPAPGQAPAPAPAPIAVVTVGNGNGEENGGGGVVDVIAAVTGSDGIVTATGYAHGEAGGPNPTATVTLTTTGPDGIMTVFIVGPSPTGLDAVTDARTIVSTDAGSGNGFVIVSHHMGGGDPGNLNPTAPVDLTSPTPAPSTSSTSSYAPPTVLISVMVGVAAVIGTLVAVFAARHQRSRIKKKKAEASAHHDVAAAMALSNFRAGLDRGERGDGGAGSLAALGFKRDGSGSWKKMADEPLDIQLGVGGGTISHSLARPMKIADFEPLSLPPPSPIMRPGILLPIADFSDSALFPIHPSVSPTPSGESMSYTTVPLSMSASNDSSLNSETTLRNDFSKNPYLPEPVIMKPELNRQRTASETDQPRRTRKPSFHSKELPSLAVDIPMPVPSARTDRAARHLAEYNYPSTAAAAAAVKNPQVIMSSSSPGYAWEFSMLGGSRAAPSVASTSVASSNKDFQRVDTVVSIARSEKEQEPIVRW